MQPSVLKSNWGEHLVIPDEDLARVQKWEPFLGDVGPCKASANSPILSELLALVPGWKQNLNTDYGKWDVTRIKGSVGVHTDESYSWVLCWLCDLTKAVDGSVTHPSLVSKNKVELIVGGEDGSLQSVEIGHKDVFVFNADRPHAWVSNFECILYQCPICPVT
jgi:hypothetical protein